MSTEIFENYEAFQQRPDKSVSGVSRIFAEQNPDWKATNRTNIGCWNCADCAYCQDCDSCMDCHGCRQCVRCGAAVDCQACVDSYGLHKCSACRHCARVDYGDNCTGLLQRSEVENEEADFRLPVLVDVHQKVLEAASHTGALNMGKWHSCETTHCRAGWVVVLAGEMARRMEEICGTRIVARVIYARSSEIRVPDWTFFETEKVALKHMVKCAEMEIKLKEQTNG